MKDHFEVIGTLTPEEFAKLGIFLDSPIYNTSNRLRDYYKFLKKNYDKFSGNGLSKDDIKKGFLKAKTLEDERKAETNYRKLVSDFNSKADEFLIFIENEKDTTAREIKLLHSYRERNLMRKFEALCKELDAKLNAEKAMDMNDYLNRKKYVEETRINKIATDYHSSGKLIQMESDITDKLFISDKLERYKQMFSIEYFNKENSPDRSFFKEISEYIEPRLKSIRESDPMIFFNYKVLKLVENRQNCNLYQELKDFLYETAETIPKSMLKQCTLDLMNYCFLMVNEGDSSYRKEIQLIFNFLDKNDLLLTDKEISYSYFKAGVDNAVSIRELEWLGYFIEKYSHHVEREYRESITNLAYTKLYLYKGEYDKARMYENKIDYKDYIRYIDAKLTLAIIEYETGNIDAVLSIFDSVKKYIKKNKDIPESYDYFYKKFISLLTHLIKLKERADSGEDTDFELKKLKKEADDNIKPYYGRLLIKSKLEEIK